VSALKKIGATRDTGNVLLQSAQGHIETAKAAS